MGRNRSLYFLPTAAMARPTFVLTIGLAAASVGAQATWIVDLNNGPGTHFTSLPPAIAVSAVGDLILVRPGHYGSGSPPAVIRRGLTIIGLPDPGASCAALQICDLPAGETVTVGVLSSQTLTIQRCQGRVFVDGAGLYGNGQTVIEDSAFVSLRRCAFVPSRFERSVVFAENCDFGHWFWWSYAPLLTVEDSVFVANGIRLFSQDGACGLWCMNPIPATCPLRLVRSWAYITGNSQVWGGYRNWGPGCVCTSGCVEPMQVVASQVFVDPSTTFRCPIGLPSVPVPRVATDAVATSGTMTVRCDAPAGSLAIAVGSHALAQPIALPQGLLWVSPQTFVIVGVGTVAANGVAWQLPLTSAVRFADVLAFQAAVVLPNGCLTLSLPSLPVVVR